MKKQHHNYSTKQFCFLLLCFFFINTLVNAQTKWIQGNIIIDHSDEKAEGVYVTNKRKNKENAGVYG